VTNPFIPADLALILASRTGNNPVLAGTGANEEFTYRFRLVSLGPRLSANDRTSYQFTTGTKFDLGSAWSGGGASRLAAREAHRGGGRSVAKAGVRGEGDGTAESRRGVNRGGNGNGGPHRVPDENRIVQVKGFSDGDDIIGIAT